MLITFFPELVVVAQYAFGDIFMLDIIVVKDVDKVRNLGIFGNVMTLNWGLHSKIHKFRTPKICLLRYLYHDES